MGAVAKSHPYGFIIEQLFYIEQMHPLLTSPLKITSGEISAKEVAGESTGKVETEQINSMDKRLSMAISTSKQP